MDSESKEDIFEDIFEEYLQSVSELKIRPEDLEAVHFDNPDAKFQQFLDVVQSTHRIQVLCKPTTLDELLGKGKITNDTH